MRINVSTINGPEKHPFCDEIVTTKLIVNQYRIDQLVSHYLCKKVF